MQLQELDEASVERLKRQHEFLLRLYQAEFAADPSSRDTEFARSNVIALRHTVAQMYGDLAIRLAGL